MTRRSRRGDRGAIVTRNDVDCAEKSGIERFCADESNIYAALAAQGKGLMETKFAMQHRYLYKFDDVRKALAAAGHDDIPLDHPCSFGFSPDSEGRECVVLSVYVPQEAQGQTLHQSYYFMPQEVRAALLASGKTEIPVDGNLNLNTWQGAGVPMFSVTVMVDVPTK